MNTRNIFIVVVALVSLTSSASMATNEYRIHVSGANCYVSDESDNDCIYYDQYGRVYNECTNKDVNVNCEIGQVKEVDGTLNHVYDVDIWFVNDAYNISFLCYLYSRDYDGISYNYDYFIDYNDSPSVQHEDFNQINYYNDDGPIWATCSIPRKYGGSRSYLYTISVGMHY